MKIRAILPSDNLEIAQVIRSVFEELGAPKKGTAYEDPILYSLYEEYKANGGVYYVVEEEGKIVGGCGISKLEDADSSICELQKMYFLPTIRGKGYAKKIIEICLEFAREKGFEICYLETLSIMERARGLYQKLGFEIIEKPMGNTGHSSCDIWMMKKL